jgi:hypothetical protein
MRKAPSFEQTTRLVARALGTRGEQLVAGFRRVCAADLNAVLDLRVRALPEKVAWDDRNYLIWRYQLADTPAEAAAREGAARCELWGLWLADALVGIVGREFSEVQYAGRRWRVSRGMDVLIDPIYAASGVGVWLSQAQLDGADASIAVGANVNSIGTIQRLYEAMPSRHSYTLPIDFRRVLPRLGVPKGAAAWLLGGVLNSLEPLLHWWRRPKGSNPYQIRPIPAFTDELLAPLSAAQLQRSAHRLEIMRSAELLNWRLIDNPRARYEVLGAFDGDRCAGYVAVRLGRGPIGEPAMQLIDWLTIGEGASAACVLDRLFDAAIRRARARACAVVQAVVLHADGEAALRRLGFLTGRDAPYLVLGLHSRQATLQALASRSEAWCITDLSFDSDGAN